jgi:hypothetical protein
MSRVDDQHQRSKIDRDIRLAREAERIKQQDWERTQVPGAAEGPVLSMPQQPARETPETLPDFPPGGQVAEVALERLEYAANDTPIGDALPPGTGPALTAARTAADLYANREMVALEVKERGQDAASAAKDASRSAARSVSSGVNEIGLQIAEGMHSVGASSYVDPLIEMQAEQREVDDQRREDDRRREAERDFER